MDILCSKETEFKMTHCTSRMWSKSAFGSDYICKADIGKAKSLHSRHFYKQKHIFSLNKSKVIKKKHSAGDFSLVKGQNAFSDTIIF